MDSTSLAWRSQRLIRIDGHRGYGREARISLWCINTQYVCSSLPVRCMEQELHTPSGAFRRAGAKTCMARGGGQIHEDDEFPGHQVLPRRLLAHRPTLHVIAHVDDFMCTRPEDSLHYFRPAVVKQWHEIRASRDSATQLASGGVLEQEPQTGRRRFGHRCLSTCMCGMNRCQVSDMPCRSLCLLYRGVPLSESEARRFR